jgi:LPXTG-motif cell wall-anchored protein
LIAPGIAFSPCGGSCTDEKAMLGATIVGLPVGLGVAGYYGFGRKKSHVIYRAGQSSS